MLNRSIVLIKIIFFRFENTRRRSVNYDIIPKYASYIKAKKIPGVLSKCSWDHVILLFCSFSFLFIFQILAFASTSTYLLLNYYAATVVLVLFKTSFRFIHTYREGWVFAKEVSTNWLRMTESGMGILIIYERLEYNIMWAKGKRLRTVTGTYMIWFIYSFSRAMDSRMLPRMAFWLMHYYFDTLTISMGFELNCFFDRSIQRSIAIFL